MPFTPVPDKIATLRGVPTRDVAAAVLVRADGRYLMQLRDDHPGLPLRGHWGLFGGGIEAGETAEAALRRELAEELCWSAGAVHPLCVLIHAIWDEAPVYRLSYFVVPFTDADLAGMVQQEGAAMAVMPLDEIARLEKISPWDLAAVQIHGRNGSLFPDRAPPAWAAP